MYEMPSPYSEAVSVAGDDYHSHFVIGQLDPLGYRQGSTVKVVESIGVHVVRELAAASDSGHDHHLVGKQAGAGSRLFHGHQDAIVTTAGAPGWLFLGVVKL
jgi:hypothetical protein